MKKTILFLLCTLCFLVAVASIACTGGGTHEHYFTQEVATVKYLASDATCTQSASYYYSCKCGIKDTNTFEYGAPLGHDFSDWQIITQPTETEEGLKTRECMRKGCGYTESENIKIIGHTHSFTEQIITDEFLASSATCVKKATYYYSCGCGEKSENTFEYGEPLGHDYINGLCTRCGTPEAPTEGLEYSLNADRQSYACKGLGSAKDTDIVVASEYNGLPVTQIADFAFEGRSTLTSITIPNSIISIGFRAFYECSNIIAITIPDSVISIGSSAFCYCKKLISITIPNGVKTIGCKLFYECNSLTSITIPDSVTLIDGYAFSNCTSLASITIPNSVISIGAEAFYNCNSIASITIPDSVTSIGREAFYNCSSLYSVIIDKNIKSLDIGSNAFSNCNNLTSITAPEGIINGAISGNEVQYHIGNSVYKQYNIGTSVYWGNENNPYIKLLSVTDKTITSYDVNKKTEVIGSFAFSDCNNLVSITIPDGVTSIGVEAFYGCSKLTSITIPDGVTSIGYGAFYNCNSLTSISIPDSVTSIDDNAFVGCDNLQYNIYDDAKYLGNENNPYVVLIGLNDKTITSYNIKPKTKIIYQGAFYACKKLVSITIPEGVTSIGSSGFIFCESLTSIVIPDSILSIGTEAFYACSGLISVTIGKNLKSIGDYVFNSCQRLESIIISNENKQYHSAGNCLIETATKTLIAGCKTSEIPADGSVTSIRGSAFKNCAYLESITIPSSVTVIGYNAFYGCNKLKSAIFEKATCWMVPQGDYDAILLKVDIADASIAALYLRDYYVNAILYRG